MRWRTWGLRGGFSIRAIPGWRSLGGVWLPLPHLLMVPFVQKMEWWQNGLAGAWPSLICYILSVVGLYRLARRMMTPRWAFAATAFYALNPNLLYLSTTAMTEPLFLAVLIWMALLTVECVAAIHAARHRLVARRLILIALLILAAVFTRYDGWILGAAVWCVLTWELCAASGGVAAGCAFVRGVYDSDGGRAGELAGVQPALLSRSAGLYARALLGGGD